MAVALILALLLGGGFGILVSHGASSTGPFSLQAIGRTVPRPAHLVLSARRVDFGSGDQTTNSFQSMTLSNAGGDSIDWQASTTQSWLLFSPTSGAIVAGQHMRVSLAVNRTDVPVGSYSAALLFTTTTGSFPLAVTMQVTPLQPGHTPVVQVTPANTPVMQVTPATLSFSGAEGGTSPVPQLVTLSNPGVLPLPWNASVSTTGGSPWLSASPPSGTLAAEGTQSVTVSVNSSQLPPGVSTGSIIFAGQGSLAAVTSPQTLSVSITIAPHCALRVSPGALSFSGVSSLPQPTAQAISVGTSQSCAAPLTWTATVSTVTGGHWLAISPATGNTPANPRIGVNVNGLKPGTYSGSLIFQWAAGTQTVPVTMLISQPPPPPLIAVAPAQLTVKGVIGHPQPIKQAMHLTTSGAGPLAFRVVATTTAGGAWLSVAPASGVLAARQNITLTVTVIALATLTPGTYSGSLVVTALDSTGRPVAGSPLTLPVTFIVQAH